MNTCDQCKLWSPAGPYLDGGREMWIDDMEKCFQKRMSSLHTRRPDEEPTIKGSEISIIVGATFYTGPKFGCTHWESK